MGKLEKALDTLRFYTGTNNQILYLKNKFERGDTYLSDFDVQYINHNDDFEPFEVNKTVKISRLLGEALQEKYNIDFTPEMLYIYRIIGEMGNSWHAYAQFRKSVPMQLMYLSKNGILTDVRDTDYTKYPFDASKYDEITKERGIKLRPHQIDGIKFLLTNRRCVLADSMGLGKSFQAIVAALEGGFKRILVICPASLKTNWRNEISTYENKDNITIINGRKWVNDSKFTIINYDIVQNFYKIPYEIEYEDGTRGDIDGSDANGRIPVIVKNKSNGKKEPKLVKSRKKDVIKECLKNSPMFLEEFDCVIIDEAQKLSNNTSIRYKVIYDFLQKSNPKAVFLLTGTPLTNRPMNLYHILKLINAEVTADYKYYCKRYCGGREMRLRDGRTIMLNGDATNLDELREKIKKIYIRRLLSDTPGMVKKSVFTRIYDLDERQMEDYSKLWDEYQRAQEARGNFDSEEYRTLVEGTLVRQFLSKEMVKNSIELAEEMIEDDKKVIIACVYQEEMDLFKEHFGKKAVVYNGKMTVKQKDAAQKKFKEDPKVKVFIGQIIAAGVGLNLENSQVCIMNSFSYVPADNLQFQDRIYRLSQTKDVEVYFQLFNDTVSYDIWDKVLSKQYIIDSVIATEDKK